MCVNKILLIAVLLIIYSYTATAIQITAGTEMSYNCGGTCNTTWLWNRTHSVENFTIGYNYLNINETENVSIIPTTLGNLSILVDVFSANNNAFTMTGQNTNFTFSIQSGGNAMSLLFKGRYYPPGSSVLAPSTVSSWSYINNNTYQCSYNTVYNAWGAYSDATNNCGTRNRTYFDSSWSTCCAVTGNTSDCLETDTVLLNNTYSQTGNTTCDASTNISTDVTVQSIVLVWIVAVAMIYVFLWKNGYKFIASLMFMAAALSISYLIQTAVTFLLLFVTIIIAILTGVRQLKSFT